MTECDQAFIDLLAIEDGYCSFNITLLFQPFDPVVDGGDRFEQSGGDFLDGQLCIFLQEL